MFFKFKGMINFFTWVISHTTKYPAPKHLNYFWTFGSLLMICLVMQMLSGLFLSCYYKANENDAFNSVEKMMRDVEKGYFMRYTHANGASFFFFCSYFHIGKAMYYQGFLKKKIWFSGLILFLALTLEAFTGYVLPWGQMSFWAATVITNFFTMMPVIGTDVTEFIWGGFTVNESTLKSFYSLHFLLGFMMAAIVLIHLVVLHDKGSSSSKNENFNQKTNFLPLYGEEIFFSVFIFLTLFSYFMCFSPNLFMHPANYEPANCLVTPPHIVPEWYLLPFYTMLSVMPDKTGGVLMMLMSLLMLFLLPFYGTPIVKKDKTWRFFFWTFVSNFLMLGYLGSCEPEPMYITYGSLSTFYYFFFLGIFLPVFKKFKI